MEKTAFDARYFDARYQEYLAAIEDYLNGLFAEKPHWADLYEAMRYSVLSGGKRLRPVMTLEFARLCGLDWHKAVPVGCALELVHTYSLIHDDLPCMDDDDLRRGLPTVHVKWDEATAVLAGDALQALAFELLVPEDASQIPVTMQAELCRLLARAAGSEGMAGGQAIDLASVGLALTQDQLRNMHRLKTGALLQASVMMGVACGVSTAAAQKALADYGAALGLAFQVVDDILDVVADSATLGKTAGKDAAADKPTYVSLLGLERAQAYAQELLAEAHAALGRSGLPDTRALAALADMVVRRSH